MSEGSFLPENHYHASSYDSEGYTTAVKLCLLGENCSRSEKAYTIHGEEIISNNPNTRTHYKTVIKIREGHIIPRKARWVGLGREDSGDIVLFYELDIEVVKNGKEKN